MGDPESWKELFSADPEAAGGYRGRDPLRAAVPGREGGPGQSAREIARLTEGLRRLARDLSDLRDAARKRTGDLESTLAVRLGEIEARLAESPGEGGSVDGAALGTLSRRLAELEKGLAGSGQQLEGLWRAMSEQTEASGQQAEEGAAEALAALQQQTGEVRRSIDERMAQAEALMNQRFAGFDVSLDQRLAQVATTMAERAGAAEAAATSVTEGLAALQQRIEELQRDSGPDAVQSRIEEGAKALRQEVTGFLNELRGTWQERIGAIAERLEAREIEERQRGDALVQSLEDRATSLQSYAESVAGRVEGVLAELAEVRQEADERLTQVTESVAERAEAAKAAFDARTEELRQAVQHALDQGMEGKLERLRAEIASGLESQREESAAAVDAQRRETAAALEARRADEEALREELVGILETQRVSTETLRDEILARLESRRGEEEALEARLARAVSEAEVRVAERVAQIEDLARAAREGATIDAERTADLASKIDERVTRGEGALEHAIRDLRLQLEERTAALEAASNERTQTNDARLMEIAEQMRLALENAVSNVRRELTVRVDENTESLEGRLDALTGRAREISELLDDRSEGLRAALELQSEVVQSSLAGRLESLEAILDERVRELQAGLTERARSETEVAERMSLVADGLSDWLRDTDERLEARAAAAEEASVRHEAAEQALARSMEELARTSDERAKEGRNEVISWLESLRADIQQQQQFEAGARGDLAAGLARLEQVQQAGREEVLSALTAQREEVLGTVEARLAALRDRLADAVGQTLSTGAALTETVQRTRAEVLDAAEAAARRAESAVESVRAEALSRAEAVGAQSAASLEGMNRELVSRLASETEGLASRVDALTAEVRAGLEDPGQWRERAAELEGALGERVAAVSRAMTERLGRIEASLPGLVGEVRANLDSADDRATSAARDLVDNATRGLKERVEEMERINLDVSGTLQRVEREFGDRLDTRQIHIEQEVQEQLSDFRIALAEAVRRIQEETTSERVSELELRERLDAAERGLADRFAALGDRLSKQVRASEANVRRRLEVLAGAVAELDDQRRSAAQEVAALNDAHASLMKSLDVMGERTATVAKAASRVARKKGMPEPDTEDPVLPRLLAVEKEIHARLTSLEKAVDQETSESRDDVTRRLALLEERWADLLEERLAGMIETERKTPGAKRRGRREED